MEVCHNLPCLNSPARLGSRAHGPRSRGGRRRGGSPRGCSWWGRAWPGSGGEPTGGTSSQHPPPASGTQPATNVEICVSDFLSVSNRTRLSIFCLENALEDSFTNAFVLETDRRTEIATKAS